MRDDIFDPKGKAGYIFEISDTDCLPPALKKITCRS